MRYRPGRRAVLLAGALTAWSLGGFFWLPLVWLIPVTLLVAVVLAAVDFYALRAAWPAIAVRRQVESPLPRGVPFAVTVAVTNSGTQPGSIEIRDEVPATAQPNLWIDDVAVPASGTAAAAQTFVLPQRGLFEFGPLWVRFRGRLGLVEVQRKFDDVQPVQVYPESLLSAQELAKDAADEIRLLDQLRETRQHGVGTEFESLEEFRAGDDPRHIDWRTTARYGRPVVRRFQIERHRDIMMLVDCGRLMGADAERGTKLDCAVDAALRLVRIALRGGDRCGLGIFDDQVLGYLRPMAGAAALPTFLSSLYDIQPRWRETDFGPMFARLQARQTKRALVIVLSDIVDAETSTSYVRSLATLARRHVVLFAALRTPLLARLAAEPLRTLDDGFRKAVTFRVLREREQAIHALRRSGVHVLDVEPAQLTAPLVNQFIELRRSATM